MALMHNIRISIVHAAYICYPAILWWRLFDIGTDTGHSPSTMHIVCSIWSILYVIFQLVLFILATRTKGYAFITIEQKFYFQARSPGLSGPILTFLTLHL